MSSELEPQRPATVRASDTDRERVVEALRRHLADGRLTLEEFGDRTGEAYAAQTLPQLDPILRDLPVLPPPPAQVVSAERARRRAALGQVRGHVTAYVLVMTLLVGLWAVGDGGFFWPIFPMLGWGSGVAGNVRAALSGQPASAARHGGCGRRSLAPGR